VRRADAVVTCKQRVFDFGEQASLIALIRADRAATGHLRVLRESYLKVAEKRGNPLAQRGQRAQDEPAS